MSWLRRKLQAGSEELADGGIVQFLRERGGIFLIDSRACVLDGKCPAVGIGSWIKAPADGIPPRSVYFTALRSRF